MGCMCSALCSKLNPKVAGFTGISIELLSNVTASLTVIGGSLTRQRRRSSFTPTPQLSTVEKTYLYSISETDDGQINFTFTKEGSKPPKNTYNVGSTVHGGCVFLIGGYQPKQANMYNAITGFYERLPDLDAGRAKGPSTYVLSDTLYVSGGHNWETLSSTSQLSLSDGGGWTSSPVSLPFPVAYSQAVVVADRVYIAGGFKGEKRYLKSMISWAEGESSWKEHADMSDARGGHGTVFCNGHIYVIGGDSGITGIRASVECYDMMNDSWSRKADLPVALSGIGCACYEKNIVVTGGHMRSATASAGPDQVSSNKIYIYNTDTDTWTTSTSTLQNETYDHVAVIM